MSFDAEPSRASRRGFFQHSAVLATAATAAAVGTPAVAPSADRRRPTARVALVGCPADDVTAAVAGHPGCHVVAAYKTSIPVGMRVSHVAAKRKLDPPAAVTDLPRLVGGSRCDAVVLAARGKSVGPAVELALGRGKTVLMTAPVGLDAADAGRLGRSATGRPAHVYFPHRSFAGTRQAIDFLRTGGLGDVTGARVVFAAPVLTRKARGHEHVRALVRLIDLAVWGLGDGPLTVVQAFGTRGKRTSRLTGGRATLGGRELTADYCPPTAPPVHGVRVGVVFEAARGRLVCRADDAAIAVRPDGEIARVFKGSGDPLAAFAKSAPPAAPLSDCWRSSAVWHLFLASLRAGVRVPSLSQAGLTLTVSEPTGPTPVVGDALTPATHPALFAGLV